MYDEKANRAYYSSRGICPYCRKNPITPGYKTCAACRERRRINEQNRVKRNMDNGVCKRCGAELDDKRWKQCKKCREDYNEKYGVKRALLLKHRRNTLRDEGRCIRCGVRFAEPGRSQCRKCLDKEIEEQRRNDPGNIKHKAIKQRWRDAGLCWDCGRPTEEGKTRCPACMERQRDSNRKYAILKRIDREAQLAREGVYREN